MDNKNIEEEKMKLKQQLEELRAGKHKSEKIIEEFRNELKKVHKDMEEMDKKRSGKIRKNSIISQDSKVR